MGLGDLVERKYLAHNSAERAGARKVYLIKEPRAAGIGAGLALAWARALGEFGATITFAGNLPGRTQTLPLATFLALETDPEAAGGAAGLSTIASVPPLSASASLVDGNTSSPPPVDRPSPPTEEKASSVAESPEPVPPTKPVRPIPKAALPATRFVSASGVLLRQDAVSYTHLPLPTSELV